MKNSTKLAFVLAISCCFFVTEIAIGFKAKSVALIADAFHYLSDIISYALAYGASRLQAEGKRSASFTFAFQRAELCGSFFNAVFLSALALSIFLQSIERFVNISPVDHPLYVIIVGSVGLVLNVLSALLVHDHHGHGGEAEPEKDDVPLGELQIAQPQVNPHHMHQHNDLPRNPKLDHDLGLLAVLLHLMGDAVNNVGVIISGVIILTVHSSKRFYADPAVALVISIIIFSSAIPLTIKTTRIFLEAAPPDLNMEGVTNDLLAVPNVLSIHDLHVWCLSQKIQIATLHVRVPQGLTFEEWEITSETLHQCFAAWGVAHVTIAPEIVEKKACGDGFDCSLEDNGLLKSRKNAASCPPKGARTTTTGQEEQV